MTYCVLAERMLKINNTIDSIPEFFSTLKPPYKDTAIVRKALNDWNVFYNNCLKGLEPNNSILINVTVNQFLQHKLNTTNQYYYRDSCMAINIMNYLYRNPNSKGIFMAHNVHISKTRYDYPSNYSYKTSGQFLSENMREKHISIAQTTNNGYFNAWKYIKQQPVFSVCKLKEAQRNSLEKYLSKHNYKILICDYSSIPRVNKMTYTVIGHTYGKTNMNYKVKRYQKLKEGKFDYVIYFESTKQSSILKKSIPLTTPNQN